MKISKSLRESYKAAQAKADAMPLDDKHFLLYVGIASGWLRACEEAEAIEYLES